MKRHGLDTREFSVLVHRPLLLESRSALESAEWGTRYRETGLGPSLHLCLLLPVVTGTRRGERSALSACTFYIHSGARYYLEQAQA